MQAGEPLSYCLAVKYLPSACLSSAVQTSLFASTYRDFLDPFGQIIQKIPLSTHMLPSGTVRAEQHLLAVSLWVMPAWGGKQEAVCSFTASPAEIVGEREPD